MNTTSFSEYKTDNFEFPSLITNSENSKEQKFLDIFKDSVIKVDKNQYPDSIFLFKKGNFLFEYYKRFGGKEIYFNYDLIWSIFERKYLMEYEEIQQFLKDMMEKHFNCKDVKPDFYVPAMQFLMEKYFNCK